MKTLTLLTSGTNASAGLIRAGACHSRLLPMPIPRTESWILRLREIRLDSGAQYGTNLPPLHGLLQVARLQDFQPQVGMSLTVSHNTQSAPVILGQRQAEQLTTCLPTWELL